jgi:hypothetical protein
MLIKAWELAVSSIRTSSSSSSGCQFNVYVPGIDAPHRTVVQLDDTAFGVRANLHLSPPDWMFYGLPRLGSNGEMPANCEHREGAQDEQRCRADCAPIQTVACEVLAHGRLRTLPRGNLASPRLFHPTFHEMLLPRPIGR